MSHTTGILYYLMFIMRMDVPIMINKKNSVPTETTQTQKTNTNKVKMHKFLPPETHQNNNSVPQRSHRYRVVCNTDITQGK